MVGFTKFLYKFVSCWQESPHVFHKMDLFHISLHLAVDTQKRSTNRPGIRDKFTSIRMSFGSRPSGSVVMSQPPVCPCAFIYEGSECAGAHGCSRSTPSLTSRSYQASHTKTEKKMP
ncbi:unnamed protein product [Clavelina lepadiformis]|uniref:Uncharacterized protein n=1 Tax=Clavelina lepadiformis TaxID=159417 RepID=A0ABP0FJY5_CLALP